MPVRSAWIGTGTFWPALTGPETASTSPSPTTSKMTPGAPSGAALTSGVALKVVNRPPRTKMSEEGAPTPSPLSKASSPARMARPARVRSKATAPYGRSMAEGRTSER